MVEHRVPVGAGRDLLAVDGFDDRPHFHLRAAVLEWAAVDDFGDSDTRAAPFGIWEEGQGRGRVGVRIPMSEIAAEVGGVELALKLRNKLGEVAVVVDRGEETEVGLLVEVPVHALHVFDIELLASLTPRVFEEVLPFGRGVELHLRLELDRLRLARLDLHRLE